MAKNGPGCSKFSEGQRVVAVLWPQFQGQGSWQQYVSIPEENLVRTLSEACGWSTLEC